MEIEKTGSPIVTPTYQSLLVRQLSKISDALDYSQLDLAYAMIKTLICSMTPTDSKKLLDNDIAHIEKELARARTPRNMDLYQNRRVAHQATRNVLIKANLRLGLLKRVMVALHNGGYLEKKGITPTNPTKQKLGLPE